MKSYVLMASLALLLSACGGQESAPQAAAPAAQPAPTAPAPASEEHAAGKRIYGQACALCHAAGVAGAPKPGDKADWAPRIAQGTEVLYKHAIEGFNGAKGAMPARGGNSTLSDDDVKAVVDYMVAQSQ